MDDNNSEDLPPHSRLTAGCKLCYEGAKLVLFLTGQCHRDCWYCPLSQERKNKDVIYANEHRISSPEEMIQVVRRMSALGTGITGGDPFFNTERLVRYARALKNEFGPEHHIHLYTGMAPDEKTIYLIQTLVDEIRFHPPHDLWNHLEDTAYHKSILYAKKAGFDVGIEVPSLSNIAEIEHYLPHIDFLNINELEWGDSNADEMRRRGYLLRGDISNAVQGGWESSKEISSLPKVHWCSSDFKDRVQLRMRLLRVAANTAREFEDITDDGTVIYGVWECDGLHEPMPGNPDENLYERYQDRIETGWWILEEIADEITGPAYYVERYPDNGIIIEVTPV